MSRTNICLAQAKPLELECFMRNGNTEVNISHCSVIYSIAKYFDMIEKKSKYVPGLFSCHRYIPDGDSIPFFGGDDYHNELFKQTRKILYSNYDSIVSYIKATGLVDGSVMYLDSINNVCLLGEYSEEGLCYIQQDKYSLLSYNSIDMKKIMSDLSGFAKLIHYDEFYRENYDVYLDYITDKMTCIEDMRVWMNEMFGVRYKKIDFLTSPYSACFLNFYESDDKSSIIITGGNHIHDDDMIDDLMKKDSFIEDRVFNFSSGIGCFEGIMIFYVDQIIQKNTIFNYNYFNALLAMYLLYCHDMQSEMSFEKEKFVNIIYRFGPQFYKEEIEPLYDKLFLLRDKKEKNLLHIYIDMLENQCGY